MSHKIVYLGISAGLMLFAAYAFFSIQTPDEEKQAERISGTELNIKKRDWVEAIEHNGAPAAYQLFLAEAAENTEGEAHTLAHLFGEALYEVEGLEGVSTCDDAFSFGCYHSFIGSAIYHEGVDTLSFFDQACKDKYGAENLPCEHGIGHGVLVYSGYDNLVEALNLCRTISQRPTGGCSGGVFMEYNFHTIEYPSGQYFRPLEADAFAPCSSLSSIHQQSCYFEQVQWWQSVFDFDYKKIASLCAEIPEAVNRRVCFQGLGHYIALFAQLDIQEIVRLCASTPLEIERAACHEEAAWVVRRDGSSVQQARLLCAELSEPYRTRCDDKFR